MVVRLTSRETPFSAAITSWRWSERSCADAGSRGPARTLPLRHTRASAMAWVCLSVDAHLERALISSYSAAYLKTPQRENTCLSPASRRSAEGLVICADFQESAASYRGHATAASTPTIPWTSDLLLDCDTSGNGISAPTLMSVRFRQKAAEKYWNTDRVLTQEWPRAHFIEPSVHVPAPNRQVNDWSLVRIMAWAAESFALGVELENV